MVMEGCARQGKLPPPFSAMAGDNVTASGGQVVCTADDVVDVGSDEGQTVVDALLWVCGRWSLSCWDLVLPLATACRIRFLTPW
jgi:hypothetical protein